MKMIHLNAILTIYQVIVFQIKFQLARIVKQLNAIKI